MLKAFLKRLWGNLTGATSPTPAAPPKPRIKKSSTGNCYRCGVKDLTLNGVGYGSLYGYGSTPLEAYEDYASWLDFFK